MYSLDSTMLMLWLQSRLECFNMFQLNVCFLAHVETAGWPCRASEDGCTTWVTHSFASAQGRFGKGSSLKDPDEMSVSSAAWLCPLSAHVICSPDHDRQMPSQNFLFFGQCASETFRDLRINL